MSIPNGRGTLAPLPQARHRHVTGQEKIIVNTLFENAINSRDIIALKQLLEDNDQPLAGIMSFACGSGDVAIVRALATAWQGKAGGAIGAHGMEAVLMNKDRAMFCLLIKLR